MRSYVVLGLAAAGSVVAGAAEAGDLGLYARLGTGITFAGDISQDFTFDPSMEFLIPPPEGQVVDPGVGFVANAAVGLRLGHGLRGEAEYRYAHHNIDEREYRGVENDYTQQIDDTVAVHAVLANVIYDFEPISTMVPYIGGGIGIAQVESIEGDDDTTVAYQVKAGVEMPLSAHTGISVEVSHMRTGDLEPGPQSFPNPRNRVITDSDSYVASAVTVSYSLGF
jgi:opacity protein-like surface antigen